MDRMSLWGGGEERGGRGEKGDRRKGMKEGKKDKWLCVGGKVIKK